VKTIDSIKSSLALAKGFTEALLKDMADEPLTRTIPQTGQHAYWLLGHLVVSEAAVLDQYLLNQPNRYQSWRPMFGIGTTLTANMGGGPTYDELLNALDSVRTSLLEYVDQLSEDDLNKPCYENDWPGPSHESVGVCLNAVGLHMMFHAGQVACARRAAGRSSLYF